MNIIFSRKRRARLLEQDPIAEVVNNIEKLGYRVVMPGICHGHWAYGFCQEEEKMIYVYLRRPDGRFWSDADVCFLLAHEYMHALHLEKKMFTKYYQEDNNPKHFIAGMAAERHCERFAREYINEFYPAARFKSILRDRIYPSWRVAPRCLPDKPRFERLMVDMFYEARKKSKKGEDIGVAAQLIQELSVKRIVRKAMKKQGKRGLVHA